MSEIEVKIHQVESRVGVEIDGIMLPDIFTGYRIKSSNSGESELLLEIKGNISVSAMSTKITK